MLRRVPLVLLALALVFATAALAAKPPKTITVNCATGQSIMAALADKADILTIEIRGFCRENVQIRRSNVTLHGLDPSLDGVVGPMNDESLSAMVVIADAQENVKLENLGIKLSERWGLGSWGRPRYDLVNCRLSDNQQGGLLASVDSWVVASGVVFALNRTGAYVQRGANLFCYGCEFDENTYEGLVVLNHGSAQLENSSFEGTSTYASAVVSTAFSRAYLMNSTIDVTRDAGRAVAQSTLNFMNVEFAGSLVAAIESYLAVVDSRQTSSGTYGNRVGQNASMLISDSTAGLATQLVGDTFLTSWGVAEITGPVVIDGDLVCTSGGDAYCSNPPATVVTGASDCALCLKP